VKVVVVILFFGILGGPPRGLLPSSTPNDDVSNETKGSQTHQYHCGNSNGAWACFFGLVQSCLITGMGMPVISDEEQRKRKKSMS